MSTSPQAVAEALAKLLKEEGGLADIPGDPGGLTNKGISLRLAKQLGLDVDGDGDVDRDDIRAVTDDIAKKVYLSEFIDRYKLREITNPVVFVAVATIAPNMGGANAVKCLQRAARACGAAIEDDGKLGLASIAAINGLPWSELRAAFRAEVAGYYRVLLALDPDRRSNVIDGWLNRAYRA